MVDRLVNSEVNDRRIAFVETCFGKSGKRLRVPGRVLVGEGVLIKMCRKNSKQRQFFLFNDILVYGSIVLSKRRYSKQHIIPLEHVQLDDLQDDLNAELKNGWLIKTPSKSFAVYAATPTEKREWTTHIERCVADVLAQGHKKPATQHAAVWVPDSEAARCMACGRTQFNLVQRRHHCRHCGAVVCAACSTHSFRIESLSKRPVRVCDSCFNKLIGSKGDKNPNVGPEISEHDTSASVSSDSETEDEFDPRQATRPTFYPD